MNGFQQNCIIHFSVVLTFVVWEEDGLGWVGFTIVGEVGGISEVVVPFLRVPMK